VKVSWRQPVFKTLLFIASNTIPLLVGLCKFKDLNLAGCWELAALLCVRNGFKLWRDSLPRGVLQYRLTMWERRWIVYLVSGRRHNVHVNSYCRCFGGQFCSHLQGQVTIQLPPKYGLQLQELGGALRNQFAFNMEKVRISETSAIQSTSRRCHRSKTGFTLTLNFRECLKSSRRFY
jgi:hypothetical protein